MRLLEMRYSEYDDRPREWKLQGCTLADINLLVGENASGKTRTLHVIKALADLLSSDRRIFFGNFEAIFSEENERVKYCLLIKDGLVVNENLYFNDENRLSRDEDGRGTIFSKEFDQDMKFQVPKNELAAKIKRDSYQHPFLEGLRQWADNLIHFYFGTYLGKDTYRPRNPEEGIKEVEINLKDTNNAIEVFEAGKSRFGDNYVDEVIQDMVSIGYHVDDIHTGPPQGVRVDARFATIIGFKVEEENVAAPLDQHVISQGMFRALSVLIQLNYAAMAGHASCVLIDDIGEGLDFDRADKLIRLLLRKAKEGSFQLIMSTNDRFVMNSVPLEYWTLVHRSRNVVRCFNQRNSPELFKNFELTGLNNFDFFSGNFLQDYLKNNV